MVRATILFCGAIICAYGQWLNHPTAGTPRTRDGKPNLAAKTPRTANGKPDLSGIWRTAPEPPGEIQRLFGGAITDFGVPGDDASTFSRYFLNILSDFKPEESPMRREAEELFQKNVQRRGLDNPSTRCLPQGIPRVDVLSNSPFKIIQTPGLMAVLYEVDFTHRQVYIDGRKLPVDPQPAWLGYSVGKWEGDVLVVDTAGFNDKSWLDASGHPHSQDLRIQERFHRRDFGHMDVQVTIEDPKMYTRPITVKVTELLLPDSDILEFVCTENEKDLGHMGKH